MESTLKDNYERENSHNYHFNHRAVPSFPVSVSAVFAESYGEGNCKNCFIHGYVFGTPYGMPYLSLKSPQIKIIILPGFAVFSQKSPLNINGDGMYLFLAQKMYCL